jgi:hypothetical protein
LEPVHGQRRGSRWARISWWEFLLAIVLSVAVAFLLGLLGLLAVRMWATLFELLGTLAVAIQIADAELWLIDGHRNWLSRWRQAWTRATTGAKELRRLARSLWQKVTGWMHVRKSAGIQQNGAPIIVTCIPPNVEAVCGWSIKPIEAETVGDVVIQVNERLARISECFQGLGEDAKRKVENLAVQMDTNDNVTRAEARDSVDRVVGLVRSIQVGGAGWAKRGLLALVIGMLIGLFAAQITHTANLYLGTHTPTAQSQTVGSRP